MIHTMHATTGTKFHICTYVCTHVPGRHLPSHTGTYNMTVFALVAAIYDVLQN